MTPHEHISRRKSDLRQFVFAGGFLMLMFFCFTAAGQGLSARLQDTLVMDQNVFGNSARITHINDKNPLLGQSSNDQGYTAGLFVDVRITREKARRYFDIGLSTRLFTAPASEPYTNSEGREIRPEYFTEISTFEFAFHQYLPGKKIFYNLQTKIGIVNRKRPIPGLALYIQGGSDGKNGYHRMRKGTHGQDNIATGGIDPCVFLRGSVSKYYILKRKNNKDAPFFELEAGVMTGYPFACSRLLFNMDSEIPVIQFTGNSANIFKLAIRCAVRVSVHCDGVLLAPEPGIEIDLFFMKFGYTSIFLIGNQHTSHINYCDHEPLMRVYVQIYL